MTKTLAIVLAILSAWLARPLICNAWPDTGQKTVKPAPVINVFSTHGCEICVRQHRDVRGDFRDRDWRFEHTVRKHPAAIRAIAEKEGYPVTVWKDSSGKPVYTAGWQGMARWLRSYDESMGTAGGVATSPSRPGDAPAVPIIPSVPPPAPAP